MYNILNQLGENISTATVFVWIQFTESTHILFCWIKSSTSNLNFINSSKYPGRYVQKETENEQAKVS